MQRQSNKWAVLQWLVPVLLAVVLASVLWFVRPQENEPAASVALPEPPAQAAERRPAQPVPGPLHPLESEAEEAAERPALVPLPSLDESDAYFRLEVGSIFDASLKEQLVDSGLIVKIVATIDNLPRDKVAGRIRPLAPVDGPFLVDGQDDSGEFTVADSNFQRHDGLIAMVEVADLNAVADLYRRFYPLFQTAYEDLGYPDGYFNDRLVEVVDHLLETPVVAGQIELVRPHVLYEFRDADLEDLSSGQKLILRMGEQHAAVVKRRLGELRVLVTAL